MAAKLISKIFMHTEIVSNNVMYKTPVMKTGLRVASYFFSFSPPLSTTKKLYFISGQAKICFIHYGQIKRKLWQWKLIKYKIIDIWAFRPSIYYYTTGSRAAHQLESGQIGHLHWCVACVPNRLAMSWYIHFFSICHS